MAHSKAKWAEAKAAYLAGEGSLKELSKRFGISFSNLMKRSAREKWVGEQKKIGRAAEERVVEKIISDKASRVALIDGVVFTALLATHKSLGEVELWDPEGLNHLTASIARMVPLCRVALGLEASKPAEEQHRAEVWVVKRSYGLIGPVEAESK